MNAVREDAMSGGAVGRHHVGGWLPAEQAALEAWLAGLKSTVETREPRELHPVIVEFQELIATDPVVRMYLTEMIAEVPKRKKYRQRHLRSVEQMLTLIDEVLTQAPEYDSTALVGVPLNAILDWAMGTPAGFAAFRDDAINAMFKKILDAWCEFLSGPDSLYVLNDGPTGWKSPGAAKAIQIDQYEYDPGDEYCASLLWRGQDLRALLSVRLTWERVEEDRIPFLRSLEPWPALADALGVGCAAAVDRACGRGGGVGRRRRVLSGSSFRASACLAVPAAGGDRREGLVLTGWVTVAMRRTSGFDAFSPV